MESYSLLSVCCLINIYYLSFENYGVTIHSVACLFFLASIFVLPFLLTKYLVKRFANLKDEYMVKRFGNAYNELDLSKSKSVLVWPVFFIMRRFMLAIAVVIVNQVFAW